MGFIQNVKEEINIIRERDPAIHSNWEVFLYPSFKAVMMYRTAQVVCKWTLFLGEMVVPESSTKNRD